MVFIAGISFRTFEISVQYMQLAETFKYIYWEVSVK